MLRLLHSFIENIIVLINQDKKFLFSIKNIMKKSTRSTDPDTNAEQLHYTTEKQGETVSLLIKAVPLTAKEQETTAWKLLISLDISGYQATFEMGYKHKHLGRSRTCYELKQVRLPDSNTLEYEEKIHKEIEDTQENIADSVLITLTNTGGFLEYFESKQSLKSRLANINISKEVKIG